MDLADFERIGAEDSHLAVIATTRADGSAQASVVNAGVVSHPVSGDEVVGFVTYGEAKLRNLRSRPSTTVVFRAGWQWAALEGPADIIGPDDPFSGFAPADLPELLRSVFRAAGGSHPDWEEYDRAMRDERRAAVLVPSSTDLLQPELTPASVHPTGRALSVWRPVARMATMEPASAEGSDAPADAGDDASSDSPGHLAAGR